MICEALSNRRLPPQQAAVLVRTGVEAQAAHTLLAVEVPPGAEVKAPEGKDLPFNKKREKPRDPPPTPGSIFFEI